AAARADSGSPSCRACAPGCWARCANTWEMLALETCALAPSSQVTSSASRPFLAAQYPSATTAIPVETCTTCRTPGTAFALVASNVPTFPPNSGEEQLPGRGTRLPQRGVGGADARAASGALHAEHRVDVRLVRGRELDPDLGPVGVELLGEQHGQRRGDALAHLRAVHHDEHALVGADPQPRVGREGGSRTGAEATASGEMKPDDQARAGRTGGLEEIPPRDLCRAAHVTL